MIWLDRDGVCNVQTTGRYVVSPADLYLYPDFGEAVALLQNDGHWVDIITNQSGLGTREISWAAYTAINTKLQKEVSQAGGRELGIFTCVHKSDDFCDCRKPKTGLFWLSLGYAHRFDRTNWSYGHWVIEDTWRGIVAAKTVHRKNRAILVMTGEGKNPKNDKMFDKYNLYPDFREDGIMAAALRILKEKEKGE
jgi:D-glycero-D-manno-heptose 1,7-bisphosphate phosphatase